MKKEFLRVIFVAITAFIILVFLGIAHEIIARATGLRLPGFIKEIVFNLIAWFIALSILKNWKFLDFGAINIKRFMLVFICLAIINAAIFISILVNQQPDLVTSPTAQTLSEQKAYKIGFIFGAVVANVLKNTILFLIAYFTFNVMRKKKSAGELVSTPTSQSVVTDPGSPENQASQTEIK